MKRREYIYQHAAGRSYFFAVYNFQIGLEYKCNVVCISRREHINMGKKVSTGCGQQPCLSFPCPYITLGVHWTVVLCITRLLLSLWWLWHWHATPCCYGAEVSLHPSTPDVMAFVLFGVPAIKAVEFIVNFINAKKVGFGNHGCDFIMFLMRKSHEIFFWVKVETKESTHGLLFLDDTVIYDIWIVFVYWNMVKILEAYIPRSHYRPGFLSIRQKMNTPQAFFLKIP